MTIKSLFLWVLISQVLNSAYLAPGQSSDNVGLYSYSDDLQILTAENYKRLLYNSNKVWYVEFYNSYCGFCQRFAPSWKAFATEIKDWNPSVGIGVLDCSNEANNQICRDFEIMSYPTLRYFHEFYPEGPNYGVKINAGSTPEQHRHKLLDTIMSEQHEGRAKQLPNLWPYNKTTTSNLFDEVPKEVKFVILIVQEVESMLGPDITMDLSFNKSVIVKYALKNNTQLITHLNLQSEQLPKLLAFNNENRNENSFEIPFNEATRNSVLTSLKNFLHVRQTNSKNAVLNKPPTEDELTIAQQRDELLLKEKIKQIGDAVFQMDLETALRFALRREVGRTKEITGDKLVALRNFLQVLVKYFPLGPAGQNFLNELKEYVEKSTVEGAVIMEKVKKAEEETSLVFSSPPMWLGCKGSSATFRGYPCGLWKMFHYLTVVSADNNKQNSNANPREVLEAMHGYIKNFFGCSDCSNHFQEMAAKRHLEKVGSFDEAILWLWEAHNEVNQRLSKDITEDPEFPKIQFPSKLRCSSCYNEDGSFNTKKVLAYLKHVYSSINVRYIGSDTRVLHASLTSNIYSGSSGVFQTIDAKTL